MNTDILIGKALLMSQPAPPRVLEHEEFNDREFYEHRVHKWTYHYSDGTVETVTKRVRA